jgi:hypothetical protein
MKTKQNGLKKKAHPVKLSDGLGSAWQKEKPDYACAFLTRHKWKERFEYDIWMFEWQHGENNDDEKTLYYLAWLDKDGSEWDDIADCNYDEYLIIEILPTMEEVHQAWLKSFHTSA